MSDVRDHQFFYLPAAQDRDTFALGERLAERLAQHFSRRVTVLAATRANVNSRRYLSKQSIVTERSGFIPENTLVVAWCPTRKLLQKLSSTKNIVLLVEPASTSFEAWAKLVGAIDVTTGEVLSANLTDAAVKALKGIVFEGYNGWHDELADRQTLAHLRKLGETGHYDRALVLQYAEMNGAFYSIGKLEKLLDRFEKTRGPHARVIEDSASAVPRHRVAGEGGEGVADDLDDMDGLGPIMTRDPSGSLISG